MLLLVVCTIQYKFADVCLDGWDGSRNLMRKDEWKNLGFSEQQEDVVRRIEEGKREEGMKGLGGDERDGKDGGR